MSGPQEYSVFANPEFDPNDYANAILAGESYPPQDSKPKSSAPSKSTLQDSIAKEDISVAISKLTFGIDDVSKQIKSLVTAHHEHLLGQAASASNLSGSLVSVRSGLNELNNSLEKLQQRVHVPYEALQLLVARLRKLQEASDILRRTSRFVILARRLQLQMSEMQSTSSDKKVDKPSVVETSDSLASATAAQSLDIEDDRERTIAKAALTISEISSVLDGPSSSESSDTSSNISLRNINAVAAFEPFVEEARNQVSTEMEQMVITGLKTLNQTVLASSLQTAFNLGVLPDLVRNLLHDLSQAVEDRIKAAFDLSKISKEALTRETPTSSPSLQSYRSRVRTEPTNLTAPQFAAALWTRLEAMFDEMAECCIKVYALEKVLKIKKNPNTLTPFLDDVSKNIQDAYETLVQPMQQAIQREISAILAKLHRIDFGQSGGGMAGGSSFCLRELSEKLAFIKGEILDCYDLGDAARVWVVSIVKFTIRNFLLHISIAKPLSEGGKLQMTSDMTELEFSLNAFMAENNQAKRGDNLQTLGEEYRALRAMRPLLFLENKQLSSPEATANLPPLIVLHHILVRSPIPLPHKLHGWQEAEYVRWLDEHTDQESWTLIDGGLSHWERISEAEGTDTQEANEYAALARAVLKNCRASRSRSAEEAVTNILYNTPPANLQPFKKHILNCLVQNEPGVLSRVSGIMAGRGFNIDSLVVCRTEIRDLSRMCIVLSGQDSVVEQVRRQLEDLVPVWAVLDYTDTRVISRELLLAKVSILGPEYVDEQFVGGPFHEPRRSHEVSKLDREAALAQNFEQRGAAAVEGTVQPALTPSEALRLKHQHLHSIAVLAKQFGAKVVDVSEHSVIVELTAKTSRVEAFLNLLKPFGILEAARTGLMAMPRTPIRTDEEEHAEELGASVDASMLPPG
ncbi:hypothetical protein EST38_g2498 [Candolleomyces aberdarensis]|uniref:Conserved oligomeric Golgi complex subunit 5 n=1 Tax=Candolleomyces aberdarensis TaxID=2316362 RepID=A0A4Q2DVD2_9AGAR|nr:hypothetical protein EST38_g2498 [Candolleomyces aberdarensis]